MDTVNTILTMQNKSFGCLWPVCRKSFWLNIASHLWTQTSNFVQSMTPQPVHPSTEHREILINTDIWEGKGGVFISRCFRPSVGSFSWEAAQCLYRDAPLNPRKTVMKGTNTCMTGGENSKCAGSSYFSCSQSSRAAVLASSALQKLHVPAPYQGPQKGGTQCHLLLIHGKSWSLSEAPRGSRK